MTEKQPSQVGRCGDRSALVLAHGNPLPPSICCLPHGHAGWHRGDDGAEWSGPQPPPDTSWLTTCCVCCGRPEHVGALRRLVERLRGKGSSTPGGAA